MGSEKKRALNHLIRRTDLSRWVSVLGFVQKRDLPLYYNARDVFVSASYWEGFGLPLLEAMACGKPVVARASSAMLELITESKAGLAFGDGNLSLANALLRVIEESASGTYYQRAIN